MSAPGTDGALYGVLAEFSAPQPLVEALRSCRDHGYRSLNAYSPQPLEEAWEAIGTGRSRLPAIVLLGGVLGTVGGFAMQLWAAYSYRLNVAGRPLNSWPAFIPVTFEMAILVAASFAVLGMLVLNGLPRPHHPVFNVDRFTRASADRYFLLVRARDALFDVEETSRFLRGLGAEEVFEVPE